MISLRGTDRIQIADESAEGLYDLGTREYELVQLRALGLLQQFDAEEPGARDFQVHYRPRKCHLVIDQSVSVGREQYDSVKRRYAGSLA